MPPIVLSTTSTGRGYPRSFCLLCHLQLCFLSNTLDQVAGQSGGDADTMILHTRPSFRIRSTGVVFESIDRDCAWRAGMCRIERYHRAGYPDYMKNAHALGQRALASETRRGES